MAEIRKHNPTTSDIGAQVRALLGDTVRPITPGRGPDDETIRADADSAAAVKDSKTAAAFGVPAALAFVDDDYDPFARPDEEAPPVEPRLPDNVIPFRAGDDPLIGALPAGFDFWTDDDDPAA